MSKKIRKFEAFYLTVIILLLLTFTAIITYQHIIPIFHQREINDDQRERLTTNQNFIINDEDWAIYLKHKKDGSSDGTRKIYGKWQKERDQRR